MDYSRIKLYYGGPEMKVRICYTIEVDDAWRRGVNKYHGDPGLATREDIQDHYIMYGKIADDDIREAISWEDNDDS